MIRSNSSHIPIRRKRSPSKVRKGHTTQDQKMNSMMMMMMTGKKKNNIKKKNSNSYSNNGSKSIVEEDYDEDENEDEDEHENNGDYDYNGSRRGERPPSTYSKKSDLVLPPISPTQLQLWKLEQEHRKAMDKVETIKRELNL